MRILVVGNGETRNNKISFLEDLADFDVDFISYESLVDKIEENYDKIILSGGKLLPVEKNGLNLSREKELIQRCTKPILGICYGFEVIMNAFDNPVVAIKNQVKEIIEISVINKHDPLTNNIEMLHVWENHKYGVLEPIKHFSVLAKSSSGVEIVKHETRKIYGVQFHPESARPENTAKILLDNFIRKV